MDFERKENYIIGDADSTSRSDARGGRGCNATDYTVDNEEIEWREDVDPNNDPEFEEFKNFYEFDLSKKDIVLREKKTDVMNFKRDFPGLWFDLMKQRIIYNIGENTLLILKKHKMLSKLMKCFDMSYDIVRGANSRVGSADDYNILEKVQDVLNACDEVASQLDHVFIQNSLNNLKNGIVETF